MKNIMRKSLRGKKSGCDEIKSSFVWISDRYMISSKE